MMEPLSPSKRSLENGVNGGEDPEVKKIKSDEDCVTNGFATANGHDGQVEFKPNPFLVDNIVNVMVEEMEVAEMKENRVVCDLWDKRIIDRFIDIWDRLMTIDLTKEMNVCVFFAPFMYSDNRRIFSKFKTTVQILRGFPPGFFNDFRPKKLRIIVPPTQVQDLEIPLSRCASTLRNLALVSPHQLPMPPLDFPANFESLSKLPFLTKLSVDNIVFHDVFKQIVSGSPHLRTIKLKGITPLDPNILRELLVDDGFRLLKRLKNLTLHFDETFPNGSQDVMKQLCFLGRNGLQLQSLFIKFKLTFTPETVNKAKGELGEFYKFIRSQDESLEELDISFGMDLDLDNYSGSNIVLFLPHSLLKLEKLALRNINMEKHNNSDEYAKLNLPIPFGPFDMNSQFPALKKFALSDYVPINKTIYTTLQGTCPTVTDFSYSLLANDDYEESNLFDMSTTFPNVSTLHLTIESGEYTPDKDPGLFPWADTLLVLVLKLKREALENFNFTNLLHMSHLKRIEIKNIEPALPSYDKLDEISLKKLRIKELLIEDFRLEKKCLNELKEKFSVEDLCLSNIDEEPEEQDSDSD